MARSACAIALVASACLAGGAAAQEREVAVDLPAGDLVGALARLSEQTGASIGTDGAHGAQGAVAVRGRMTVGEALRRLLAASRWRAERVAPATWRLVPRARTTRGDEAPAVPEVVVTGRKLPEALSRVPAAVAIYRPDDPARPDSARADAHDVAAAIEGLSMTNLGPGRDRPFIRGIADSPFNGFSQTTVSVVVDEARVTYDAPEPGLRLVDVARVEVMKGPQGPLYGTGALGGVYRIVTNRPVPGVTEGYATQGFGLVEGGGPGAAASVVVNAPLLGDRAAVRLVGYAAGESGWVRNAGVPRGVNDSSLAGLRVSARLLPAAGWTLDLAGTAQRAGQRDSRYVDRDAEDLTRSARIAEPSDGTFHLVNATVEGRLGAVPLTAASSHSWQDRTDTYAAGVAAAAFDRPAARAYRDRRSHRVIDEEVRLSSAPGGRLSWVAGASYLAATTQATGELAGPDGVAAPVFLLHRAITETAVFGEMTTTLSGSPSRGLRLSAGGRLFRATTDDERREQLGMASARARATVGVTPSASLTYDLAPGRLVYLRFGSAFRPGGLNPANTVTGRYEADQVRSLDLGTRLSLAGGRLSVSGGAFATTWTKVQSDYLEANGLVATRTAGDASIVGAEVSAEWRPGRWWLRGGGVAQQARLVDDPADATGRSDDQRLPVVPDATARFEIGRAFRIGGGDAHAHAHAGVTYVGRSRLSFDPGLDRGMGGYAAVDARIALRRRGVELRVDAANLLDARADTFAFGNPFMIRIEREYTPLRPRAVSVTVGHRF